VQKETKFIIRGCFLIERTNAIRLDQIKMITKEFDESNPLESGLRIYCSTEESSKSIAIYPRPILMLQIQHQITLEKISQEYDKEAACGKFRSELKTEASRTFEQEHKEKIRELLEESFMELIQIVSGKV